MMFVSSRIESGPSIIEGVRLVRACLSWAMTYIRQSELGRFASRLDTAHAVIMAVPQCGETDAQEITIDLLGEDKL